MPKLTEMKEEKTGRNALQIVGHLTGEWSWGLRGWREVGWLVVLCCVGGGVGEKVL